MSECKVEEFSDAVLSIAVYDKLIAIGLNHGGILIHEIIPHGLHIVKGHDDTVNALLFTSDGRLISASNSGIVKMWALQNVAGNYGFFIWDEV